MAVSFALRLLFKGRGPIVRMFTDKCFDAVSSLLRQRETVDPKLVLSAERTSSTPQPATPLKPHKRASEPEPCLSGLGFRV